MARIGGAKLKPQTKKHHRHTRTRRRASPILQKPAANRMDRLLHTIAFADQNTKQDFLDPIAYLSVVRKFLRFVSKEATRALEENNENAYVKLTIIASAIAEAGYAVFTTQKAHLRDDRSAGDELASLLAAFDFGLGSRPDANREIAHLLDESRVDSEPLEYIDDMARFLDGFLRKYNDPATNVLIVDSMSVFASFLASGLLKELRRAKQTLSPTLSVADLTSLFASVVRV